MKKHILLIFIFSSQILFSQSELKVLVFEKDTKTTLAFASIILEQNNIGYATDIDGFALLRIKDSIKKDVLKCSYIGYKEKIINLTFPKKDTLKIYLESEHVSLDEIIVTANIDSSNGEGLIRKAIDRIEVNYRKELSNLETFYEEKVYKNKKLIELNQSINTIIYDGYPQKRYAKRGYKKHRKFDTFDEYKVLISKNPKAKLLLGNPQYFKYYNSAKDQAIIKTKRISDSQSKEEPIPTINGGPLALTALDKVKFLSDYLDPKLLDKYDYVRKGSKIIDDQRCFAIGFKPKSRKKVHTQRWDKKIEFAIYSGTLYISKEDYAIVRIESTLEINESIEHYKNNRSWQVFPNTISALIEYTKSNDNTWRLKSIYSYQFIKAGDSKIHSIMNDYICERKLIVFNQSFTDLVEIDIKKETRLLHDVEFTNLRNFPSNYYKELWTKIEQLEQVPNLSEKEVKDLTKKFDLNEQFMKNN